MIIFHSVSPAKELSNTNEKKSSNGLSPPSESSEIFRFYNYHMLTITLLVIETVSHSNEFVEIQDEES